MDAQEIFMAAFVDELEKIALGPLAAAVVPAITQTVGSVFADKAVKALKPKKQPQASTTPLRS